MRRLFALLLALIVVLGVSVGPASGSDDDDRDDDDRSEVEDRSGSDDDDDRDDDDRDDDDDEDRSGSNSGSDDDDDDDDDDDEDRSGSNSGSDDDDDDDDDDDSGHGRGRGRGRGRGGRDDTGTGTPGGGAPPAPDPGAPPATSGTVRIVDDAFSPSTVTVATGATVTFTNADDREHTVTADDRSFDSGVMAEGASFAQTFPEAGTFDYFCLIHSDMTGTVVVGDSPASSSSGSSSGAGSSSSATPSLRRSTGGTAQSGGPALSGITPPNSSVPGSITVPAPLAAAAAQDAAVEVRDFAFAPDGVTVGVGATVTWTLVGEAPHTVTGDGFDSGILSAGDTFSQTFDEAGQFDYRCELHPEMTATVTVAAADASGGAPPDDAAGDAAPDDAAPAAGDDAATAGPSLANTGIPISTAIVVIALLGLAALAAFGWSRRGAEE